jgi:SLA1 Homology Domain 1 (SHD1) protein
MQRLRYPVLAFLLLNAFALGDETTIDYEHRWQGQRRRRELKTPAPATVAFGGIFFLEVVKRLHDELPAPGPPKGHPSIWPKPDQDLGIRHSSRLRIDLWDGCIGKNGVWVVVESIGGRNRLGRLKLRAHGHVRDMPERIREVANYSQVVLAEPDKQFVKRLEGALTETAADASRRRQRFAYGQVHIDIDVTTERGYHSYEVRVKLSALQVRTWTDSTGQYRQKAGYIEHDAENVRLISEKGRETAVSIVKLSVKDREWLNDTERTMSFIVQPTHTTLFE